MLGVCGDGVCYKFKASSLKGGPGKVKYTMYITFILTVFKYKNIYNFLIIFKIFLTNLILKLFQCSNEKV